MSRAFAKEEDSLEAPIVPPRAALPPGTPNYVTPRGLDLLRQELQLLEAERARAEANRDNEADRTRQLSVLNGRLSALVARLATAKVVDPRAQPPPGSSVWRYRHAPHRTGHYAGPGALLHACGRRRSLGGGGPRGI